MTSCSESTTAFTPRIIPGKFMQSSRITEIRQPSLLTLEGFSLSDFDTELRAWSIIDVWQRSELEPTASLHEMDVKIRCLCGSTSQELLLDQTADQTVLNICHCSQCRRTTGLLFSTYRLIETRPAGLDKLASYRQSDCITRYFCRNCGAHAFVHLQPRGQYLVATGLIEDELPTPRVRRHWGFQDTRDGGLRPLLPGENADNRTDCWLENLISNSHGKIGGESMVDVSNADVDMAPEPHQQLRARCHCGGVEFDIKPPDESSLRASSPWPDLLVPYHSESSSNKQDVKWWLRAKNTKYLAGTCACRSCRLSSGFPIQAWAFILKSNILQSDGSALAFGIGTMQQYESSPTIYREFCSRCGATIFWHCEERPSVLDVSAGLFHAASGSRAEEWLDWVSTGRVSFAEDALDRDLVYSLGEGFKTQAQQHSTLEETPVSLV